MKTFKIHIRDFIEDYSTYTDKIGYFIVMADTADIAMKWCSEKYDIPITDLNRPVEHKRGVISASIKSVWDNYH